MQQIKQEGCNLEAEMIKCIRCGACQAVCPIYKEIGVESYTARGKVRLLRAVQEGLLPVNQEIERLLSHCLLCSACVNSCPAGVKTNEIVEAGRTLVVNRRGLPLLKRVIFNLGLKNRKIFNSFMALLPGLQRFCFRRVPGVGGMLPRYPLGLDQRRLLHPVASRSFRNGCLERVRAEKPRQGKVALFTGCMANFLYPETAEAAVKVLTANGLDVIIPRNQHCCGTPARVSGDRAAAKEMARINVDEFASLPEPVDAIIVLCGSCGTALKKEIPVLLAGDPVYEAKARAMADQVRDIAEFIVTLPSWRQPIQRPLKGRVTYHDPCHLGRGQGITAQPREILRAIPGLEYVELPRSQACCGCAGTFSASHYDLSLQITQRKMADIESVGAEWVATGCSACRMQMEDGLNQAGRKVKVRHTIELLWESYRQ